MEILPANYICPDFAPGVRCWTGRRTDRPAIELNVFSPAKGARRFCYQSTEECFPNGRWCVTAD